ncbi:hypothetical protein DL764_007921 [Monosporascus ibericus]|uniref:Myb-like domain-containing protein n=1 Tax=Monosporascus ibericus TaxID=155417 RepID=A0A4Q4SYT0_9PEZI|nr:hypothetical protein DL764_007921 [Monosporascus ibericus]
MTAHKAISTTATVDIASLLKAPGSNESSSVSSPPLQQQQQQQGRSASVAPTAAAAAVPITTASAVGPPFLAPATHRLGLTPASAASAVGVAAVRGRPGGSGAPGAPGAGGAAGAGGHGKRSMPPHASESPAKKQSKWSAEEDALIIELRGGGMKWEDISKRLPGRSAISCRLHYQNYLERRSEWDEERKNKLARLYERFKPEMWAKVAEEMAIPWRAAEAMHWQLGEHDMARRAGVTPFSLTAQNVDNQQGGHHHRGSPRHGHGHSHSQGSAPRELIGPGGRWARAAAGAGGGITTASTTSSPQQPQQPPPPPPPPMPMPTLSRSYTTATRRNSGTSTAPAPHQHYHHLPVVPHHTHHHPSHHSEHVLAAAVEGYPHPHQHPMHYAHHQGGGGVPLAPIQTPHQSPRQQSLRGTGMMLPGVAELTTGVSPYSTPAYSIAGGARGGGGAGVVPRSAAASPVGVASPGPFGHPAHPPPPLLGAGAAIGYAALEPIGGSKRRRSSGSPEMSRRRQHLEPRADPLLVPRHAP